MARYSLAAPDPLILINVTSHMRSLPLNPLTRYAISAESRNTLTTS